jgi:hypothetical protein
MLVSFQKRPLLLIISSLSLLSVYSCGMKKSNDITTQNMPVAPTAGLNIDVPDGILYVNNAMQTTFSS